MPPRPSLPPTIPACDPHDGTASLQLIEDLTTHAGAIQQRVLREILAMNAGTDYLRGFLGASDDSAEGRHADELAATFKERVPVVEYKDVKPFIERIANGAPSSLISSKTITELLTRYIQLLHNVFLVNHRRNFGHSRRSSSAPAHPAGSRS